VFDSNLVLLIDYKWE
jgi:hypothetical protein